VFSKHYQGELAFLRAAGKAYAEANPSAAGLLARRGTDPEECRLCSRPSTSRAIRGAGPPGGHPIALT
jgi:hypothetical protein